jgi:hypothetical protein
MNCDFQSFGMGLAFVFFMIFILILVLLASDFFSPMSLLWAR